MSYFLPRLESGWHADQAILAEDNRVVVIRFGHDWVRLPFVSPSFPAIPVSASRFRSGSIGEQLATRSRYGMLSE